MVRHLVRSSSTEPAPRDRADDLPGSKASAITGHVDYLELAERVIQGVSVDPKAHPHRPGRRPRRTR
jgi:hypothetical protein